MQLILLSKLRSDTCYFTPTGSRRSHSLQAAYVWKTCGMNCGNYLQIWSKFSGVHNNNGVKHIVCRNRLIFTHSGGNTITKVFVPCKLLEREPCFEKRPVHFRVQLLYALKWTQASRCTDTRGVPCSWWLVWPPLYWCFCNWHRCFCSTRHFGYVRVQSSVTHGPHKSLVLIQESGLVGICWPHCSASGPGPVSTGWPRGVGRTPQRWAGEGGPVGGLRRGVGLAWQT